jgi:hypothetical protein
MAFQPITEAEAQALTRRQLLHRVEETQAWLDRPPRSAANRAAGEECSRVMHAHLSIGRMLDSSLALVLGQRGAGVGYLDERIDGSPGRPATRVQLSRQRRMPYGCKNVARAGTATRSPWPSMETRRWRCSGTCSPAPTATPTCDTRA